MNSLRCIIHGHSRSERATNPRQRICQVLRYSTAFPALLLRWRTSNTWHRRRRNNTAIAISRQDRQSTLKRWSSLKPRGRNRVTQLLGKSRCRGWMRRRDSKYVVQMATVSSQQSSLSTEILQESVNSRLRSRRHGLSNDISNYLALISIRRRSEMDSWPRFGLMKNQAASFHTSQAIRKRSKPRQLTMLE